MAVAAMNPWADQAGPLMSRLSFLAPARSPELMARMSGWVDMLPEAKDIQADFTGAAQRASEKLREAKDQVDLTDAAKRASEKIMQIFQSDAERTFEREPLAPTSVWGMQQEDKEPLCSAAVDAALKEIFLDEAQQQVDKQPLQALAIPPQVFVVTVPEGHVDGEEIWIQGPHGPMSVQANPGTKPGEEFTVRLGPAPEMEVEVPKDAQPGEKVWFTGPHGEQVCTEVPEGKKPGDMFEVCPATMSVRVPDGAEPGSYVQFKTLDDRVLATKVPEGCTPGQYFSAYI